MVSRRFLINTQKAPNFSLGITMEWYDCMSFYHFLSNREGFFLVVFCLLEKFFKRGGIAGHLQIGEDRFDPWLLPAPCQYFAQISLDLRIFWQDPEHQVAFIIITVHIR